MNKRKVLLYVYCLFVFIFGICRVPMKSVYDGKLDSIVYAPLWSLKNTYTIVNGDNLYYEVDIHRVLVTLLVFTLITFALYHNIKKK